MNKERKVIIAAAAAAVLGLAALAVRGYLCTRVATIVNDEAVWDLQDSSPSMKVILLRDGAVARFVSESDSTYVGDIQDSFEVPKTEADVEIWYACDGKGVVFLKDFGVQPAFGQADETSSVAGQLRYDEGLVPVTYRCLGFKDGWFAIDVDGRTGYVREDKVIWDAIDSF